MVQCLRRFACARKPPDPWPQGRHADSLRVTFSPVRARAAARALARARALVRLAELHSSCLSEWLNRPDNAGLAVRSVAEAGRDRRKPEAARSSPPACPRRDNGNSRGNRGNRDDRGDRRRSHNKADDNILRNRSGCQDILRASLHMVHSVGRLTRLGERSAGRPGKEPAHEINGKAQRTCLSARQRADVGPARNGDGQASRSLIPAGKGLRSRGIPSKLSLR